MMYIKSNFQKESGRIVVLMLLCLFAVGLEIKPAQLILAKFGGKVAHGPRNY